MFGRPRGVRRLVERLRPAAPHRRCHDLWFRARRAYPVVLPSSQLVERLECLYTPLVALSTPPPDYVRAFSDSMPATTYRKAFDSTAIATHARLSGERRGAVANAGTFSSSSAPGTAVCVVAEDRPGLLATISAALVMCGLDVILRRAVHAKNAGRSRRRGRLVLAQACRSEPAPATASEAWKLPRSTTRWWACSKNASSLARPAPAQRQRPQPASARSFDFWTSPTAHWQRSRSRPDRLGPFVCAVTRALRARRANRGIRGEDTWASACSTASRWSSSMALRFLPRAAWRFRLRC